MVQQQAEARPPVQPGPQPEDVRNSITSALMSPQREAERPAMQSSVPATTAAFAPPAGGPPATPQGDRAPLQITVGGPDMKGRSIGAYLKPTAVPRGVENLDPKVQQYVAEVSKAYPGVKFTSGYRSPSVNAAVGGATNSEHMRRLAVDMDVSGVPADQRRALIADARMRGAGGLGNYGGNSIHVDFRTGTPVAWGPNRSYTSLGQTPDWFRSEAAAHRMGERPQAVAAAAPPPPAPPAGPPVNTLAVRPSPMMQEQPPQVAQAAPPGGDQQDAVLQDVLGAGARPGLRGATASLGRAGVMNDAAPDSPVGAGIAASVDARRNAIAGSLSGQPQTAPAPAGDVQVAQAPGGTAVDSDTIFSPRPVKTVPVKPYSDIQKAPEAALPSQEPIPGQPPPAGPVAPFQAEPMTAREKWLRDKAADPRMPDNYKAMFAKEAAELEQDRRKLEDRRWDLHKTELERYYKNPERELTMRVQRAQLEKEKFEATQRPVQAAKAETDLAIAQQNLEKYRRENLPSYVERERLKAEAELANAQRTATKPDSQSAGGTTFERPYTAPGQPQQPYAVPPGLPQPKEERTADQAKAYEFVQRVRPDLDILDNELQKGRVMSVPTERIRDLPLIGNMTISDEYRRANQAWTNFEGGFMQRASGAAVSPSEAMRNIPAFKPMPGDTPQDLADKSRRRRDFVDAVEQSSGPAGVSVIREQIQKASDAMYDKQQMQPAVRVKDASEAMLYPPGQRIIHPETGKEVTLPRRKVQ